MIRVTVATPSNQQKLASLGGIQKEIYEGLKNSRFLFHYYTDGELLFELFLRENIIKASIKLKDSGAAFTSFKYSAFNPQYWMRTEFGYLLKPFAQPADAVNDIFTNGKKYGFECTTAIVVIYYKAVLDSIRRDAFNFLFGRLLVWNWNYDPDLAIITQRGDEFIPGDVVYFANPDYRLPIWIGENAVYVGKGLYFGHGIGVGSAEQMIESLNTRRKEGATRSAYMLKQHSRLNVKYLYQFSR
ncbi:protein-glutamine gamma-glutamyltransferase [Bacillus sp. T33-2]|uniref:protein-glutamine gamma-glutamyltransferase n=1 Tax=Bacillus sp. T33-2 TaxID=2054168 RepID=UPI000C78260D|nr:protein-glutamine gamma-glutamyltransferase [Bacillus sp. T33-2]PLR97537.1 protein-glutamine gamma-glutamyltransferase [Bacillus sp. T33-2]